ncbi:MAG: hypothetical protein K6E38_03625 [Fretibacterium sp.]|nr:hypothetical protein [Fretibacterium sp.]
MKKIICVVVFAATVFASTVSLTPAFAMTDAQRVASHGIIHSAAAAAAASAAVLAQASGADNIPLTCILGGMTIGLCVTFDISLNRTQELVIGMDVVAAFTGWIAVHVCTQWIAGWIPIAGNYLNAAVITGMVEYIGWEIADALDTGNEELLAKFLTAAEIANVIFRGGVSIGEKCADWAGFLTGAH